MARQRRPLPPVENWQPLQVQLIVFPTTPQLEQANQWWKAVAEAEPDAVSRKVHERVLQGTLEGRALSLAVEPHRVMWTAQPYVNPDQPPEALPTLGPFPAARDWFVAVMKRWLPNHCPPVRRLAFGCRLVQFTEGREAAYRLLSDYLPTVDISEDSHDFQYRINRKRHLRVGQSDVNINRLSTWSSVRFALQVSPLLVEQPAVGPATINMGSSCMVEIDVNTDSDFRNELDPTSLMDTYWTLAEWASEIATQGDIQ